MVTKYAAAGGSFSGERAYEINQKERKHGCSTYEDMTILKAEEALKTKVVNVGKSLKLMHFAYARFKRN